jgi:hypothetical protein
MCSRVRHAKQSAELYFIADFAYLFIYLFDLIFSRVVSSLDYTASCDKMISEYRIGNNFEGSGPDLT